MIAPILIKAGQMLGSIVAQMGIMLLSERVVRKVAVSTLRHFQEKTTNKLTKEIVDTVADAWEPPKEISK